MQNNTVLQRFKEFRETFVSSSNVPSDMLLDIIESYITPDSDNEAAAPIAVHPGQLSLFDIAAA